MVIDSLKHWWRLHQAYDRIVHKIIAHLNTFKIREVGCMLPGGNFFSVLSSLCIVSGCELSMSEGLPEMYAFAFVPGSSGTLGLDSSLRVLSLLQVHTTAASARICWE